MTEFIYLSSYSNRGLPDRINLDENDSNIKQTISTALINEINTNLPGGVTVVDKHPEWIRKSDLETSDSCEITLSFITEGAGYKNALAYYVYNKDSPPNRFSDIQKIFVVFPNASKIGGGGRLAAGDTIKLAYEELTTETVSGRKIALTSNYVFPEDKGIGFVCLANQWKGDGTSWAYLNTNHRMYSSDPALNPEYNDSLKHHCINYRSSVDDSKIIFGFEDLRRDHSSDDDFNDLVFLVTPSPISSINVTSFNSMSKQSYNGHILCEDIEEVISDFDYNDLTLKYYITEHVDDDGKIGCLYMKFQGKHRGALYNHDFGVIIPGIKSQTNCKIYKEVYVTENGGVEKKCITSQIIGSGSDKIPIIKNTKSFLVGDYTNTTGPNNVLPSYVVLKILFPTHVSRSELNDIVMPYRFYLDVYTKDYTVLDHTIYSDSTYPSSQKMQSLGIPNKKKIIVIEGCDSIGVPIEKRKLHKAYPKFITNMRYNNYKNWYSNDVSKPEFLREKITHIDNHSWDSYLGNASNVSFELTSGDSLLMCPTSFDEDGDFAFSNNGVVSLLGANNLDSTNILDWDSISPEMVEKIVYLVNEHGDIYVKKSGSYNSGVVFGDGDRCYYVSTTSKQTNPGRLIHNSLTGSTDTLELLSWTGLRGHILCLV